MEKRLILDTGHTRIILERIALQITENHGDMNNLAIIGMQPRGVLLARKLVEIISRISGNNTILYGELDSTFYRDDFRGQIHIPSITELPFSIEKKKVILIDDVLYTGRTIRAAMDALLDHGRAQKVELCILVDRKFSRELPIQPDYVGKSIDSIVTQKVKVYWGDEKQVVLYDSI